MPIATRRQAQDRGQARSIDRVGLETSDDHQEREVDDAANSGAEQIADDEDEEDADLEELPFPPPGLKDVSSLASWTVSTAKPGNGVAALRSPDTRLYWQSDGPQPHLLSIHFFRLVSLVHMRIYLDFEADESYTPTKIQFLAGMGVHDLQEFAEMSFEQPTGWIEVDFSNVGPIEESDDQMPEDPEEIDWSKRPVLRAFLVQVKILENHQNGKDTHLRAVQLFARDDSYSANRNASMNEKVARKEAIARLPQQRRQKPVPVENNIRLASWMTESDLR